MGDLCVEMFRFMAIENAVSPRFGPPLEKNVELRGFPDLVEKVDFIRGGMVEKPKDFHSPIMPQVRV